jgi:hypothetical protein
MTEEAPPEAVVDPGLLGRAGQTASDLAIRRLFNAAGVRPPLILWSPTDAELGEPLIAAFARHVRKLAGADGRLRAADATADSLGTFARWCMILDGTAPDGPFRYRHFGENILPYATRGNMTGSTPEDYGDYIGAFFAALYRAAAERGEWVLSEHEPPREVFLRSWQRLIVPLYADDGATVAGFVVMAVPENSFRAGLDLLHDPVFVLDDRQRIHHCNRAARTVFADCRETTPADRTLRDATGIALALGMPPTEVLARGEPVEIIEFLPRAGILEQIAVTVSATQHRGHAFYVVVMRLTGH